MSENIYKEINIIIYHGMPGIGMQARGRQGMERQEGMP